MYTLHSLTRSRTFHQFAVTTGFCNPARRLWRCGKNSTGYGADKGQEKAQVHRNLKERVKKSLCDPGKIHLWPPLADSPNPQLSPESR